MRRFVRTAFVAVALAIVLSGCGSDDDGGDDSAAGDTTSTSTTTSTTSTTSTSPPPEAPGIDFGNAADVDLGGGWATTPCGGDAPLTCITKDGEQRGVVELLQYPVDDDGGLGDDLEARVADYYATFEEDRSPEQCGPGYSMTPDEPQATTIGATPAIRYGFTAGPGGDGSPTATKEKHVSWMAIRGDTVWVIGTSAYDDGACLANEGDFSVADLEAFLPILEKTVQASEL